MSAEAIKQFVFRAICAQETNTKHESLVRLLLTGKKSNRDLEEIEKQALILNFKKAVAEIRDNFINHLLSPPKSAGTQDDKNTENDFRDYFHKQSFENKKAVINS